MVGSQVSTLLLDEASRQHWGKWHWSHPNWLSFLSF